jgi:hypothetical protein
MRHRGSWHSNNSMSKSSGPAIMTYIPNDSRAEHGLEEFDRGRWIRSEDMGMVQTPEGLRRVETSRSIIDGCAD